MGKMLTLKTPLAIPEHDLFHAHNIRFTTYSINRYSLVLPEVIVSSLYGEGAIIFFLQDQKVFYLAKKSLTRQTPFHSAKIPVTRHLEIQVPTMGKDNIKAPDFKIPVPYVPEEEK
jgi:hypothetical protein